MRSASGPVEADEQRPAAASHGALGGAHRQLALAAAGTADHAEAPRVHLKALAEPNDALGQALVDTLLGVERVIEAGDNLHFLAEEAVDTGVAVERGVAVDALAQQLRDPSRRDRPSLPAWTMRSVARPAALTSHHRVVGQVQQVPDV
ncbi:MAG: hypothetical protein U5K73_00015 [Halofilum sp. (in: g-proteobacteria)]|nr:hypothetical protein [Halofilum sp. (in: g-proteobacteria)]